MSHIIYCSKLRLQSIKMKTSPMSLSVFWPSGDSNMMYEVLEPVARLWAQPRGEVLMETPLVSQADQNSTLSVQKWGKWKKKKCWETERNLSRNTGQTAIFLRLFFFFFFWEHFNFFLYVTQMLICLYCRIHGFPLTDIWFWTNNFCVHRYDLNHVFSHMFTFKNGQKHHR